MPNKYFKPHERFDRNPHRYDIGIFTGLKKGYEDNLFIKKLFALPEQEYADYYQYHLTYFLGKEPQGEQEFFSFVWQIAIRRIRYIETKNPFNSSHALDTEILEKLLLFQKHLRSIVDKTYENAPFRPTLKGPLCQLKGEAEWRRFKAKHSACNLISIFTTAANIAQHRLKCRLYRAGLVCF